jgi:hypothetical protein
MRRRQPISGASGVIPARARRVVVRSTCLEMAFEERTIGGGSSRLTMVSGAQRRERGAGDAFGGEVRGEARRESVGLDAERR